MMRIVFKEYIAWSGRLEKPNTNTNPLYLQGIVYLKSKDVYFDLYYFYYGDKLITLKPKLGTMLYSSELGDSLVIRPWRWTWVSYSPHDIYHYNAILSSSMTNLFHQLDYKILIKSQEERF